MQEIWIKYLKNPRVSISSTVTLGHCHTSLNVTMRINVYIHNVRIIDLSFDHLFAIADEELTNSGMLDATAKEVIAQGIAR